MIAALHAAHDTASDILWRDGWDAAPAGLAGRLAFQPPRVRVELDDSSAARSWRSTGVDRLQTARPSRPAFRRRVVQRIPPKRGPAPLDDAAWADLLARGA